MSKEQLTEISLEELIPQGKYKWNNLITKRKHSTQEALKVAKQFFENFDLSYAKDVAPIVSEHFSCSLKKEGFAYFHFKNRKGKLIICDTEYCEVNNFFDLEIFELDFSKMTFVFKNFLRRIDALMDNKDLEIAEFIEFCRN